MNIDKMISKLKEMHGNDEEQLRFILSDEKKIIITASAGCGKTKTMISKIAYELITTPNLNFKKILALTFSVNASTKIKEDTASILPALLDNEDFKLDKKLDVSNYHSFSMKLLFKHGYSLAENLNRIYDFKIVPDTTQILNTYLIVSEQKVLSEFSKAVDKVDMETMDTLFDNYKKVLLEKLIPNDIITYNGLLILGNELLENRKINSFYKEYYPIIIVDEFQDTNYLSYKIINNLIGDDNKVYFMGDDIQKIYGFLGAMPNLFTKVETDYNMTAMEFSTNYRFKDNPQMLQLDKYIRQIFRNYDDMDNFDEEATVNMKFYKTENGEINSIYKTMMEKLNEGNSIALLVNKKGSAAKVIEKLESEEIRYYNGLFNDTDADYVRFHRIAFESFISKSGTCKSTATRVINEVLSEVKEKKNTISSDNVIFNSLLRLLNALFDSVKKSNLSRDEKYIKISYVLANNSLKRLMNEIDEPIVITTMHGSKGLEWDFVFIPKVMKGQFPVYIPNVGTLCQVCQDGELSDEYEKHCKFLYPSNLKSKFEEELSLFYVAITRAKKDVFLYANSESNFYGPKKMSCLGTLPNLTRNNEF